MFFIFLYFVFLFIAPQLWVEPFIGMRVDLYLYPAWLGWIAITGRAGELFRLGPQDKFFAAWLVWIVVSIAVNGFQAGSSDVIENYLKWFVLYRLTVVDLTNRPDMGANFLNEAGYALMREGDVLFTDFPRVYQDARSIYGVTLVVDRMDGSRVRSSLYYHKGRLYIADAVVLPARGDKDMSTPSRYDQTIRFPPDGRFD